MNFKLLAQVLVNTQWQLELIGNELMTMDKPYGEQVLKLAKELDEVITELTIEGNKK